jgi:two-component system LytT family sensor kinase
MNTLDRRKLFLYSSLFIALVLTVPKLLALRKNGVMARYWHFDLGELLFQFVFTFFFCLVAFFFNMTRGKSLLEKWKMRRQGMYLLQNLLILSLFILICTQIHYLFFQQETYLLQGYGMRFGICLLLVGLELRIYFLLEEARRHEVENEHLRTAYLKAELALLKGQLNPHFLFNALSSLSAVVREDPRKAQEYIQHLSRAFRYSLQSSGNNLVPVLEEVQAVRSYAELLKMRYEGGFQLSLPPDESLTGSRIPPMSLQLLVENALKHNGASAEHPLLVEVSRTDEGLEVRNNLQPTRFKEPGTGIGLANLNERFKILLHREIAIQRTDRDFIVKLPLP